MWYNKIIEQMKVETLAGTLDAPRTHTTLAGVPSRILLPYIAFVTIRNRQTLTHYQSIHLSVSTCEGRIVLRRTVGRLVD